MSYKKQRKIKTIIMSVTFVFILIVFSAGYSLFRESQKNYVSLTINKPVFTITLNNGNSTTAGTSSIFVKYGKGYYLNSNVSKKMSTTANGITTPTKSGLLFMGYYTGQNGTGIQYIDKNGMITSNASTTYFTGDGELYAYFITVAAENLSYNNIETDVNCSDIQCMLDHLASLIS